MDKKSERKKWEIKFKIAGKLYCFQKIRTAMRSKVYIFLFIGKKKL